MKRLALMMIVGLVLGVGNISAESMIGITKTPEIQGRVVDATTGEPLENVVITCDWSSKKYAIADTVGGSYKYLVLVTDKDGKFTIPKFWTFRLGSWFDWIAIGVIHPLYETERVRWPGIGEADASGIIHWEVKLTSLEERYVRQVEKIRTIEEKREVIGKFYNWMDSQDNGFYWEVLKEKNVAFALEDTFKIWDGMAEKQDKYLRTKYIIEKTKIKIRNNLE